MALLLISVFCAAGNNDHLVWWRQNNDELCWSCFVNSRLYMHLRQKGKLWPDWRIDMDSSSTIYYKTFCQIQQTRQNRLGPHTHRTGRRKCRGWFLPLFISLMFNLILFFTGWTTSQFGVSDFGLHLKQKPQVLRTGCSVNQSRELSRLPIRTRLDKMLTLLTDYIRLDRESFYQNQSYSTVAVHM